MSVIGEPLDNRGPINTKQIKPIHAEPPEFIDQSTVPEVLETGIKVVDLLAPYARGGKIGLLGGAGVGKTVLIMELINNVSLPPAIYPDPPCWTGGSLSSGFVVTLHPRRSPRPTVVTPFSPVLESEPVRVTISTTR